MKFYKKLMVALVILVLGIGTFIGTALACECDTEGGACGPANCCGCGTESVECTDCDLETETCRAGRYNDGKDGFAQCDDKC